jgi:hypothetical protein
MTNLFNLKFGGAQAVLEVNAAGTDPNAINDQGMAFSGGGL